MHKGNLEIHASRGDVEAQLQLAEQLYEEQEYEQAIYYYKKALKKNRTEAMNGLAITYFSAGMEDKYDEAIKLLEKGTKLGDAFSAGNLGLAYRKGVGVEQNPEKSFQYFEIAAKQGNMMAMDVIATYYEAGYGVEKSHEKAEECRAIIKETERMEQLHTQLDEICISGNECMGEGLYQEARDHFFQAMKMAEENQMVDTYCWIYAAIGDSYYQEGDYEEALAYFQDAYYAVEGELNPYVCMMNGICYHETGKEDEAKAYLKKAYEYGGWQVFQGEDLKYLAIAREE